MALGLKTCCAFWIAFPDRLLGRPSKKSARVLYAVTGHVPPHVMPPWNTKPPRTFWTPPPLVGWKWLRSKWYQVKAYLVVCLPLIQLRFTSPVNWLSRNRNGLAVLALPNELKVLLKLKTGWPT